MQYYFLFNREEEKLKPDRTEAEEKIDHVDTEKT